MKGIYISNYNLEDTSSGVSKKITMQLNSFNNLGIEMEAPKVYVDSLLSKIYSRLPMTSTVYDISWGKYLSKKDLQDYDFIYIRHNIITRKTIKNLKCINKYGVKVFYEIPTYPYDRNENEIKNFFLRKKDKKWRAYLNEYVNYIVDYSGTDFIYNIPTIQISNGIDTNSIESASSVRGKTIDLIAVALIADVHGFDRVIKGLREYYSKDLNDRSVVRFHIVGDGVVRNKLQQSVQDYGLTNFVKFYGLKTGEELEKIYNSMDIGVGVLGIHRRYRGQKVSSLKTKEYAAKGLPFITAEDDEAFLQDKFKYDFKVDSNDSPINIEEVVQWYTALLEQESLHDIRKNIRNYAKKYLSWDLQLIKVVNKL